MKPKSMYLMLLLMIMGVVGVKAQVAVTVGEQVTDVNNIVSGKAYLLRWDALTGTPYVLDTGTFRLVHLHRLIEMIRGVRYRFQLIGHV